ncbi:hypothetical protein BH09PLA1_BH09PLA1_34240 [soil metagenome]
MRRAHNQMNARGQFYCSGGSSLYNPASPAPRRFAQRADVMSQSIEEPPRNGGVLGRGSPARAMSLVTLAWVFGSVWMTATSGAPLTQFARSLGASNFQFGLLAALPFIASLLSLPASVLIDRTGKRKRIFLWGLYAQRVLWIPIALAPVWMIYRAGTSAAPAALVLSLWLIFLMHAMAAVGSPAWVSWMADLVPERVRGKYFSRRRQWGILSAIPAAWIAGWLLDRPQVTGATNAGFITIVCCAIIFVCAAIFGIVDIAMFHFVDEIPVSPHPKASLFKSFAAPLRNRSFLWFGGFVATLTFAVSFMGQFLTLFLIEKLHISNRSTQMMLLIAPMIAQLITLPAWGAAVDRFGKRPVLAISALALVPVAFGWCLMNGSTVNGYGTLAIWMGYALAAAGAALWAGVEVANFNLVLEFSGSDEHGAPGSSYVAVNSVIVNLAGCAGGLDSGLVAQSLKNWAWETGFASLGTFSFYEVLFVLSGALRLLSVVIFLPRIHEPQARPAREALRFMTANIHNNLFSAAFVPLRMVGIGRQEKMRQG